MDGLANAVVRPRSGHGMDVGSVRLSIVEIVSAYGALVAWFLVLRRRDGDALWNAPVEKLIRRTHWLPIILQGAIYAYWSLYSEAARVHAPMVAVHVLFAVVYDLLFSYSTERKWRVSLTAIAPAFSLNLFIWYEGEHTWVAFLWLALGLSAKRYVRWRNQHLFNPSALAISLGAVAYLVAPSLFPYRDVVIDFMRAPNMLEIVFLVSLVPLALLGTAPVTVGGLVALLAFHGFHLTPATSPEHFVVTMPSGKVELLPFAFAAPWLLALTLFAGDPATVPRTVAG